MRWCCGAANLAAHLFEGYYVAEILGIKPKFLVTSLVVFLATREDFMVAGSMIVFNCLTILWHVLRSDLIRQPTIPTWWLWLFLRGFHAPDHLARVFWVGVVGLQSSLQSSQSSSRFRQQFKRDEKPRRLAFYSLCVMGLGLPLSWLEASAVAFAIEDMVRDLLCNPCKCMRAHDAKVILTVLSCFSYAAALPVHLIALALPRPHHKCICRRLPLETFLPKPLVSIVLSYDYDYDS